MTTIIRGPRPPELEAWLERRRQSGLGMDVGYVVSVLLAQAG